MSKQNDTKEDAWNAEEDTKTATEQQPAENHEEGFKSKVKQTSGDNSKRESLNSERPPRRFEGDSRSGERRSNYGERREYRDGGRQDYEERRDGYSDRRNYPEDRDRRDNGFVGRDRRDNSFGGRDRRETGFDERRRDDFRYNDRRERDFPSRDYGRFREERPSSYGGDDFRKRRFAEDDYHSRRGDRFDRGFNNDYERRPKRTREDPLEPNETIGIFNLSYNLTPKDFEDFLNEKLADFQGKFTQKLVLNRETGNCRGYGFITFSDINDSIEAKKVLENGEILGQPYRAAFSIQKGYSVGPRTTDETRPLNSRDEL